MDAKLDTLAASRKLEKSGMPEPLAEAVVEVVDDAMNDLVTKEYFKIELDRSFNEFERKIDHKLDERFGTVDKTFEKIDERFEKIDKKFDKVDERFEKVDERFEKIDKKFDKIDGRFDKIDKRFEKVDEKFEKVDISINELKLSIAELGKSQAWGFVTMCGINIASLALLFAAMQFFGTGG